MLDLPHNEARDEPAEIAGMSCLTNRARAILTAMTTINELSPNPENPRRASKDRLALLKRALAEYGDLGGVIYNRKTKRLVGGHQRQKIFGSAEVQYTKRYDKPTKVGTVAEGFVVLNGERFAYREVQWDSAKEKAANIAANKGVGEWDLPRLSSWLDGLELTGFDVDLSLFDKKEREELRDSFTVKPEKKAKKDKDDEKKRVMCPECHHKFVPGWS